MSLNASWHKQNRMPPRATLRQRVKWHLEHAREWVPLDSTACACRDPEAVRFAGRREMIKGRFEIVDIEGMTVGRASYEPGWKWSKHVGRARANPSLNGGHVGLVVSGTATAAFDDGRIRC